MNAQWQQLRRSRLAWSVGAVLAAGIIWWLYRANAGDAPVSYELAGVDRGEVVTNVASSGAVSPLITVTVGSEVSGKLTAVLVDFNTRVSKGQLLAQIDPSTFRSRLQSAEADLVVQQANVGSREVDVSSAQVSMNQAQRDYDRARALFDRGLVSANDSEKARDAFEQAQNSVKIAQANLNNARSQIVKVKATLDQARIDLARTEIRSPVDGVVISRKVDTGQTVAASMQAPELFQIARDLSLIQIETKVDEADIGSIKENAPASFTVDAFPERSFTGRVAQVRINGTSQQNVVTYSVMVQAENPEQMLLPGMTANVKILTAQRSDVLRVASAALRFRPPNQGGDAKRAGPTPPGAAGAQPAGPGVSGAHSLVDLTPEVMKQLGLSTDQQSKATQAVADVIQRTNAEGGSGSGPLGGMPNMRAFAGGNAALLLRQRLLNALGNILSADQLRKYQAMGSMRSERAATVWVPDARGNPVAHAIRVGLTADNLTEVVSGLAEGDQVIVRARAEQH